MSRMMEYIDAATGYDANNLPASSIQFTFGTAPFMIAETEDISELAEITTVCQSDAIATIEVIDDIAKVEFDFSAEPSQTFVELFDELEFYNTQKQHVINSLNELMQEFALAEENEDEDKLDSLQIQMRALSIPFMIPTLVPVTYGGVVNISFANDPKFVFFTSDKINQHPYKVTMIFDAADIFCQDDVAVYTEDSDAEIQAQQEELWYMQEAQKMEEEAYQSQFGFSSDLSYYGDDNNYQSDKRLKGIRSK